MRPEEIEGIVRTALPGSRVSARDTTGGGDHWHVTVIDDAFQGMLPIARQRLIMQPFKPMLASGSVHALDLVAVTRQEARERGVEIPPEPPGRQEEA